MAILESGPVAFEIRVLSAWSHGQVYALDWRWQGCPVLNPALVRSRPMLEGEPKARLICEGREYALPSAIFWGAEQLPANRRLEWEPQQSSYPLRTRVELKQCCLD